MDEQLWYRLRWGMWALVTFCRALWRPKKEMGHLSGAMGHNSDIAGVCNSSVRAWFRGDSRLSHFRHPDKSMKLMYDPQATCCLRTPNSLSFSHLHRKDGGPGEPVAYCRTSLLERVPCDLCVSEDLLSFQGERKV